MYLGIDIGTSGVKTILIDDRQALLAEASSTPLEVERAYPGWSEQHPDLWWTSVCQTLDDLHAQVPAALAAVKGIGLSGQMYGACVLGADDRPLRNAILWNDTRTHPECAELESRAPRLREITWRKPTPGITATKLLWLRRHEPETFARIATVMLPKDYVRLCLSGERATDLADASGTMWVDLARRDWSDEMLAATGLSRSQMPALHEGTAVTGRLRAELASRWGMAHRPVVAAGGGDNACGACGTGVIDDGDGTVSLGTSGVLFLANDTPRSAQDFAIESLCHAVPGRWHQMSVVLSATSCVNWLAARLKRPAADLVSELGAGPHPATDLLFIPFLDGNWSPRNDAQIRGGFVGLAHQHDDAALTQAVLQGVAFAIRECADAFRAGGSEFRRLLAIGGGSRSELWLSMLATLLETELDVPTTSALGAALGAARLGMIAATGAAPADVLTRPEIGRSVAPARPHGASYEDAYARWQAVSQVFTRTIR